MPKSTKEKKTISGIIEITRRGVGYVPFEKHEDIEIQPKDLRGALNGDTVEVELKRLFPRPSGTVKKVVARAKEEFVCTIAGTVATPSDPRFYRPIRIDPHTYADGEKVLVRLLSFTGTDDPKGVVVEHLGRGGEHRVEMNAIVLEHGFRIEFPEAAAQEARAIEAAHAQTIAAEVPRRRDFRTVTTFTIDPVDAKDFDDALSIRELPNGEYEVGVHIADVTHFVLPGSALEQEAQKRGTSVYLVDATIPMLPLELSSNVCSLREGEDRLAFSALFRINREGVVLTREFAKTIIRSDKRFTYESAQEVLDSGKGPFAEELGVLRQLSRLLKKEREHTGAIDFGDNEIRFVLDPNGVPLRVVRKERLETMSLIEEFMLLANREVARHIAELARNVPEKKLVFLYRIHDEPKQDRIEELSTFVRAIGYDFAHKKKTPTAKDIQQLLRSIKGKPEEHLIRTATLRSMAKAIYSTKNIGHFGLSFEYYTHFTSPIRRYPDMLAHRILHAHLGGAPILRQEFSNLEMLCIKASEQEAKAVDAERESIRYKQVEYMQTRVGQTFDAVISGVTDWGLYVEEKESASEGLVRIRTLGDDFYQYVPKEYALLGQKTKRKYALGDAVRVKLIAADLKARTLDFELLP
jgi:ribonuclease R